ncbi:MAG: EamA family transporter [Balneolaceae bacterium]|nr:EamA family transporter [Balneolaceae bacterium]
MSRPLKETLPYLMVAAAAVLWGGIGVIINALDQIGFSSLQIVALRAVSATLMLLGYLLVKEPGLLKIEIADIKYFIGTGVLSIAFFNWCYFTAIKQISLSVAVILLYTGPAFVVLMSRIFFGEPFTKSKMAALVLTLLGCAMVVELIPIQVDAVSWYGILAGLGSGFGYALYSIFGKIAQRKYSTLTILFYTFLMASLAIVPFSGLFNAGSIPMLYQEDAILWTLSLGFFPTVLAYLLYTEGLSKIEAGRASITALLEPVAATLLGVLLFNEWLSIVQVAGIVLVVMSVMLIQLQHPFARFISQFKGKLQR